MESCLKNNHSHNEPLSGKIITLLILLFTSIVLSSQVVEIGGILPDDRTFYSDTTYIIVQDVTVNNKNTLTSKFRSQPDY